MNSEKLDKLLDNLTSGLDGDLEVQLDVRNELQAHLEDKDELLLYYGAADTCICLASGSLNAVIEACLTEA